MSDFASAAMLRVLRAGMLRLGLDPQVLPCSAPGGSARIELDLKRRLVGAALAQGGWSCLPLLGQGMQGLPAEPIHQALLAARHPAELWARWQRLERYIHSHHRTRVHCSGDGHARLQHASARSGSPPSAAEDLVVLGLLAALLARLGAKALRVSLGDCEVFPRADEDALRQRVQAADTALWDFRWQGLALQSPQADFAAAPATAALPLAERAAARLRANLLQAPPLQALAEALGLSSRSLQRALAAAGWSYSRLLAHCRSQEAAAQLLNGELPLAEIGFVCGYADQAHFTREFRERVGLTPARFRADFRPAAPALTPP